MSFPLLRVLGNLRGLRSMFACLNPPTALLRWRSPLFLLLLILFSGACSSRATQAPTMTPETGVLLPSPWTSTPTVTATHTAVPTYTPRPTSTVTPTPTASPFPTPMTPLSAEGPWLLGSIRERVIAMNPDGTGLTDLKIYSRTWSTKGWVSARVYSHFFAPSDASIRIVRLPSTEPVRTIRLLSDELAAQIDESEDWDPLMAPDVYQAVLTDRSTMRWSPDGRYLAFIAAIDGPSADLYVYDTQTDQVHRLTDGPNQAVLMDWSLDGKWIVHMEATNFRTWTGGFAAYFGTIAVWAASMDGSEVKKLYDTEGGIELIMGWRAPSVFVALRGHGEGPPLDLRSVDVKSGGIFSLYEGEVYRVAADWGTEAVAYIAIPEGEEIERGGLYLLRSGDDKPIKIDVGKWALPERVVWFPETGLFYTSLAREVIVFDSSGEILMSFENEHLPVPSPDGRWLAFPGWDGTGMQPGLRLYTSDGEFLHELSHEKVSGVIWNPDSTGVFFNEYLPSDDGYAPRLMYAPIPEGEPSVVHPNPAASFFAWVEP
jgi:hypothetical protein